MTKKRKFVTVLLLGLLTTVVPFSIDMYLPGFPDIAKSLNTTVSKVALSLSSFFIGIGVGQLLYGPLLDRYGRKKPLYAGLLLYCITSIACAYASSIEMLIGIRFIQAIGACSATIAATAMVRDFFPPGENAKIFSFLMLVLSVSPMLAPTAGGFISEALGWRYMFIALTIMIIIIFIGVLLFLGESKSADKSYSLKPRAILKNYAFVLRKKYFTIYAFTGAFTFAGLFSYIASSPAVFIEHYGLTQKQYGLLFAVLASGLIIASQVNTVLLKKYASERIVLSALIAQNSLGALMLAVSILGFDQFFIITGILFLYLSSIGFVMPNASALAMKPFEKNAGSASALLGFIQMGLGSLATIAIGMFNVQTTVPMGLSIMISSILGVVFAIMGSRLLKAKG